MVWQPEVDEIKYRRELAEKGGDPERIARQHQQGKLTIRERITLLADPGSFEERARFAGSATYDDAGKLVRFVPKSVVLGTCRIDGRKVFINGQDITARGGGYSGGGSLPSMNAAHPSMDLRIPYIRLIDSFGGSAARLRIHNPA